MPPRPHLLASRSTRSSTANRGVWPGGSISYSLLRRGICKLRDANTVARFGPRVRHVSLLSPSPACSQFSTPQSKRNFSSTSRKNSSIWDEDEDDIAEPSPVQKLPGRPLRARPAAHRDLGSLVRSRLDGAQRISQRAKIEKQFSSLTPYQEMVDIFIQLKYKSLDDRIVDCMKTNQLYKAECSAISSTLRKQSDYVISRTTRRVLAVEKVMQQCMTEWAILSKSILSRLLAVVPHNTEHVLQSEETIQRYIAEVISLSNSIHGFDRMQAAITEIESIIHLIEDEFCRTVFTKTPEWTRKLEIFNQNIAHWQNFFLAVQTRILHHRINASEFSIHQLGKMLDDDYLAPRKAARSRIDQILIQDIQNQKAYEDLKSKMQIIIENPAMSRIRNICLHLMQSPNMDSNDRLVFSRYRDILYQDHCRIHLYAHHYRHFWLKRQLVSHSLRESALWNIRDITDKPELRKQRIYDFFRAIAPLALGSYRNAKMSSHFEQGERVISLDLQQKYKALWEPIPARSPKLHIYWRQLDALGLFHITEVSCWYLQNEAWYLHYSLRGDHGKLWAGVPKETVLRTIEKVYKWCLSFQNYRVELQQEILEYRHLNWLRLRSETILHSMGEPAYLAGKFKVPSPMSQDISRFKMWTHSMGRILTKAYVVNCAQRLTRTEWEFIYTKMGSEVEPTSRIAELGSSVIKTPKRKRGRRQLKSPNIVSVQRFWKGHVRYSKPHFRGWPQSLPTLNNKESVALGNTSAETETGVTQNAAYLPASQRISETKTFVEGVNASGPPNLMDMPTVDLDAKSETQREPQPELNLPHKTCGNPESPASGGQLRSKRIPGDESLDWDVQRYRHCLKRARGHARTILLMGAEVGAIDIAADAANILLRLRIRDEKVKHHPRLLDPPVNKNIPRKKPPPETSTKRRKKASRFLVEDHSASNQISGDMSANEDIHDTKKSQKATQVARRPSSQLWGIFGRFTKERQQDPDPFTQYVPPGQGKRDCQKAIQATHKATTKFWGNPGRFTKEHQQELNPFSNPFSNKPSAIQDSHSSPNSQKTMETVSKSLSKLWGGTVQSPRKRVRDPSPASINQPSIQNSPGGQGGQEVIQVVSNSRTEFSGKTGGSKAEIESIDPHLDVSISTGQNKIPQPDEVTQEIQRMFNSTHSKPIPLEQPLVNHQSQSSAESEELRQSETAKNAFNALFVKNPLDPGGISNHFPNTIPRKRLRSKRMLLQRTLLKRGGASVRKYSADTILHQTKLRQEKGSSKDSLPGRSLGHLLSSGPDVKDGNGLARLEKELLTEGAEPCSKMSPGANNTTEPQFWTHSSQKGPNGQKLIVHYCRTLQSTERTVQHFLGSRVIGFDMEWKAQASASDSIQSNVSLIQIANEERIALFQIAHFTPGRSLTDLVSPSLKRLIESPDIMKVGVSIKADCTRLRKYLGIDARGTFELSHLYKLVKYGRDNPKLVNKRGVNLSDQVKEHFGLPLEKSDDVRCGDWARPLNYRQVQYAATDPYACVRLFHAMEAKRRAIDPTPPRPAYAELNQPIILPLGQKVNEEGKQPLI